MGRIEISCIEFKGSAGLACVQMANSAFNANNKTKRFGKIKYAHEDYVLDKCNNMAIVNDKNELVDLFACDRCYHISTVEDILLDAEPCCLKMLDEENIMSFDEQIKYFIERDDLFALKSIEENKTWTGIECMEYYGIAEAQQAEKAMTFFGERLEKMEAELKEMEENI